MNGDNRPSVRPVSRREFVIRLGGMTAAITLVGAGGALASRLARSSPAQPTTDLQATLPPGLPNVDAEIEPAPGTRLEYTPVDEHFRLDLGRTPDIEEKDWTLAITGMVDEPLELTLDDIRERYEPVDQYITLACISNSVGGGLIGTTRWTGARLAQILDDAGVQDDALCLNVKGADGFYETLALEILRRDEDRIVLAYDWDGEPLAREHGFPLRLYVPDLYGMRLPKWIEEIEVSDSCESGYWVQRNWDPTARVKTTSVIDTVAVDHLIEDGDRVLVPIGGIAYAGARGISKVEVRADGGEWVEAALREPLSDTTWVIWRYDWPFEAGRHTFEVRCYEADGTLQIEERDGSYPSGATGIDSKSASL